jgi:electron transfer flavoprotein alpha subunit
VHFRVFRCRRAAELLGEAAAVAARIGGSVTAVVAEIPAVDLSACGADRLLVCLASYAAEWAEEVARLVKERMPHIVLVEGTSAGRMIASTIAARSGLGLIGDGIEIEVEPDGALVVWKPAFAGRLVAPIRSASPVQVATIRPGVFALREPPAVTEILVERLSAEPHVAKRSGC